jgi:hypothetical protein
MLNGVSDFLVSFSAGQAVVLAPLKSKQC